MHCRRLESLDDSSVNRRQGRQKGDRRKGQERDSWELAGGKHLRACCQLIIEQRARTHNSD